MKTISEYAEDIAEHVPITSYNGMVMESKADIKHMIQRAAEATIQQVIKDCDTYESDMR